MVGARGSTCSRRSGSTPAVIPHYDNQEGGNHDERFCYLGERRLAMLEPELPNGAFVLGLDEHTGVIIDLDADTSEIVGKGALTLRRNGSSVRHEAGSTITLDVIRSGGAIGAADAMPTTATTDSHGQPTPTRDATTDGDAAPSLAATAPRPGIPLQRRAGRR